MNKTKSNRLITEFFPSVTRPRRRVNSKELALQQDNVKKYFVSTKSDPKNFAVVEIKGKGKGVRTICPIPKGSFVCEYAGDLLPADDAKVSK